LSDEFYTGNKDYTINERVTILTDAASELITIGDAIVTRNPGVIAFAIDHMDFQVIKN
jgi:hypothetical protein